MGAMKPISIALFPLIAMLTAAVFLPRSVGHKATTDTVMSRCNFSWPDMEQTSDGWLKDAPFGAYNNYAWSKRTDGSCHAEDNQPLLKDMARFYRLWGAGI